MTKTNDEAIEAYFKEISERVVSQADDYLLRIINAPPDRHSGYIKAVEQAEGTSGLEEFRLRQLADVSNLCGSARSLTNTPLSQTTDAKKLFAEEIQLRAFEASVKRLHRANDILAAMEVVEPYERMIEDKDYLIAIFLRNTDEEGPSAWKIDDEGSGPEIVRNLTRQVEGDMFESEKWAKVAHFAGDLEFAAAFQSFATVFFNSSLKHWRHYYEEVHRDRETLRDLLTIVASTKAMSIDDFRSWDKSLRDLFVKTQDTRARKEAFEMWELLIRSWTQALLDRGEPASAKRLEELARNLKTSQLEIWRAREFTKRPSFRKLLAPQV